jgi:hypothetical protein
VNLLGRECHIGVRGGPMFAELLAGYLQFAAEPSGKIDRLSS